MGIFKMHIFVNTVTGKSLSLNVQPNCEISEINNQIETLMGVPSEEQILINNGQTLINSSELTEESQIYMVVDIEGGKKKKRRRLLLKRRRSMFIKKLSSQY